MSFRNIETLNLYDVNATTILVGQTQTVSSIHRLRSLNLRKCCKLSCISSTFEETKMLQNVEDLSISSCRLMETLLDLEGIKLSVEHGSEEVILGQLNSVIVSRLDELTHIWRNFPKQGFIQRGSFHKLERLIVGLCPKLRNIFLPSMVKLLVNLEVIDIHHCANLEQVIMFEEEAGDGYEIGKNMIEFPKLRYVRLSRLPCMKNFVTYSKHGSDHSHNGSLFTKMISLPRMETLELENMGAIKIVFDMEGLDNLEEVIFGELKTIKLESLDELRHIWRHFPKQGLIQRNNFSKLKEVEVSKCDRLKYMVSHSVAELLVNLQNLKVAHCKMMEQVMMGKEDEILEVYKQMDTIAFPKLKGLKLEHLENLISFYMGIHDLEFASLDRVSLYDCPSMDNFCNKSISTPKLKSISYGYRKVWSGDLNTTVRQIKQKRYDLADEVEVENEDEDEDENEDEDEDEDEVY